MSLWPTPSWWNSRMTVVPAQMVSQLVASFSEYDSNEADKTAWRRALWLVLPTTFCGIVFTCNHGFLVAVPAITWPGRLIKSGTQEVSPLLCLTGTSVLHCCGTRPEECSKSSHWMTLYIKGRTLKSILSTLFYVFCFATKFEWWKGICSVSWKDTTTCLTEEWYLRLHCWPLCLTKHNTFVAVPSSHCSVHYSLQCASFTVILLYFTCLSILYSWSLFLILNCLCVTSRKSVSML